MKIIRVMVRRDKMAEYIIENLHWMVFELWNPSNWIS